MKTLLTDAALVVACRRGDVRAQRHLYTRFAPLMLSVCRRYVGCPTDAEEVLMLGFGRVFGALHQYAGSGSLEGWVRRIMVREALLWLRRKRPLTLSLDDAAETGGRCATVADAATPETELSATELLALIAELPAGYRTVFNLYALEGYAHAEIAALLGISESTSKSQLSRARAQLQRRVSRLHSVASCSALSYAA